MNLKDKRKNKIKTLSLRLFYSEMIKLVGCLGLYLYLKPRVYRISKKVPRRIRGGAIIATNHSSTQDPIILFLVFWYRRLHFPAAAELFEKPINRFFFYNMNCIAIDRSQPYNVGAVKQMCALLKRNKAVAIFPEGAINTADVLLEFKKGTAYMAKKSRKPIIPVYIGERKAWWRSVPVILGEPIYADAVYQDLPRGEAIDKISELLREEECRLADYCKALQVSKKERRV